jgi:hypothetical protein
MRFLKLIILFSLPLAVFAQDAGLKFKDVKLSELERPGRSQTLKSNLNFYDSLSDSKKTTVSGSKKSPGLAFIYGLLIPGMGHVYADRFESGKYFMITEAAVWLTYATFYMQ